GDVPYGHRLLHSGAVPGGPRRPGRQAGSGHRRSQSRRGSEAQAPPTLNRSVHGDSPPGSGWDKYRRGEIPRPTRSPGDRPVRVPQLRLCVGVKEKLERELEVGDDGVVVDLLQLAPDVHRDDDVRPRAAGRLDGDRLHNAAVHVHLAVDLHRREDPRDGHAGDDGPAQGTPVQPMRVASQSATGIPSSSNALRRPIWLNPRAAPPPSTTATTGAAETAPVKTATHIPTTNARSSACRRRLNTSTSAPLYRLFSRFS